MLPTRPVTTTHSIYLKASHTMKSKLYLYNMFFSRNKESKSEAASFSTIMKKLKSLNEDMKILHNSIDDLTLGQREHEEHTDRAYSDTQDRINFMNYRILEIRQITGAGGLSKVHIQRIKQMKRGSIFADRKDNHDDAELTEDMLKESEEIVKQQVISVWKKKTDMEVRAPSPSKRTKSPTKTYRSKSPVKNTQNIPKSPAKNSRSLSPPKSKPKLSKDKTVDTLTVSGEDNSEASSTKDSGYDEILTDNQLNDKKSKLTNVNPIITDQNTVSPRKTKRSTSPKKKRDSIVTESPKKRKKKSESESKLLRPNTKSSSFDSETVSIKSIKNDSDSQNLDDDVFEKDFFGING